MKTLLVVDMQNGFITNDTYIKLKDKINTLISSSNYKHIIATKFINNPKINPLFKKELNFSDCYTNKEQELCINIPESTVIYNKYGYGLDNKSLKEIQKLNIKEIDICGLEADACVYAIALQLFDINIKPNILWNYVECEDNLKETMKKIFIKQFGNIKE